MNLPNKLTVSRFAFTALFLVAIFMPFPGHETAALLLFSAGGITDFLDGQIARRRNLITNFGILMDPLADKILVCSAFIALIELRKIEAWMVILIVARELAITGLRMLGASKNVVLAADTFGKHKTISQIVTIIATLLAMSYMQWGRFGELTWGLPVAGRPWIAWMADISQWVAVVLTVVSGFAYLWRNRRLYLDDM